MTREEAEKYADNMTYRDAINNLMKARSIPYRKATFIKINELLKALEQEPILDKIRAEIESITPKAHIRTGKLSIDTELMIPLDRVLKVIDKYKAESESDA